MEVARGNAEDLNLYVYKKIKKKVTRWPLGQRALNTAEEIEVDRINEKAIVK